VRPATWRDASRKEDYTGPAAFCRAPYSPAALRQLIRSWLPQLQRALEDARCARQGSARGSDDPPSRLRGRPIALSLPDATSRRDAIDPAARVSYASVELEQEQGVLELGNAQPALVIELVQRPATASSNDAQQACAGVV